MDQLPELPVYSFIPTPAGLASLILTLFLPLLVAVITTRVTSAQTKFFLLLALVAVKTTIDAIVANNYDYINFAWVPFLMTLTLNLVIAIAGHFGIWKSTGASQYVQANVGVKVIDEEAHPR